MFNIGSIQEDMRLGGIPRPYYISEENCDKDLNMQIPDEIRKCVVFIAGFNKGSQSVELKGTGFLVSIPFPDKLSQFSYLVTAKHIISGIKENQIYKDKVYVRINKNNNSFDYIEIPIESFVDNPDASDVSVFPFNPDHDKYDYKTIPIDMLINKENIKNENMSLGDEVFMTGLFVFHSGKERNIPIIRVGNISAMPEEPVSTSKFGDINAYLVELRSLGGLSGSSVFLHVYRIGRHRFYLLGLLHGHWDLKSATQNVVSEDCSEGNKEKINTGIGIVIPSEGISKTLNHNILKTKREEVYRATLAYPTMDSNR